MVSLLSGGREGFHRVTPFCGEDDGLCYRVALPLCKKFDDLYRVVLHLCGDCGFFSPLLR